MVFLLWMKQDHVIQVGYLYYNSNVSEKLLSREGDLKAHLLHRASKFQNCGILPSP